MPDHSSRFYTARLRLSAAVAGAIAAAALALGSGLVPARAVAEEGARYFAREEAWHESSTDGRHYIDRAGHYVSSTHVHG